MWTLTAVALLMLGIAPDDTGRLPVSDAARLREFGEAVQRLYGPEHNLTRQATHVSNSPAEAAIDNDAAHNAVAAIAAPPIR